MYVAVIIASIAAVAYGRDRDIATWWVVSGLAVLSPPSEQWDIGRAHGWSKERQLQLHDGVTCGSHSARRTCWVINVAGNQRAALDHKHTNIHGLSYGIVPAGWLLSRFFTKKMGESSNGSFHWNFHQVHHAIWEHSTNTCKTTSVSRYP